MARNALDQAQTDAFVNKLGIALVSIEDPITGNSATGKLSRGMQGLINAWFSDSLAERTQDRMRAAVRGGADPCIPQRSMKFGRDLFGRAWIIV